MKSSGWISLRVVVGTNSNSCGYSIMARSYILRRYHHPQGGGKGEEGRVELLHTPAPIPPPSLFPLGTVGGRS